LREITSDVELQKLRAEGRGYIYNDFGTEGGRRAEWNVLHEASCRHVRRANVSTPKYFFDSLDEAMAWLRGNRGPEGRDWKRCGTCLG
jgi:hypothetical protein